MGGRFFALPVIACTYNAMLRRQFIRNSALGAIGASLLPSARLIAATTPPAKILQTQPGPVLLKGTADDIKLTPADSAVLNFVAGFGSQALFTGGCVAAKCGKGAYRSTHLLALISDLPSYQSLVTQRGAITGRGMTIGNSICFNYQQTTFELEALLPDAFNQRVADIKSGLRMDGTPMVYAHEALLYDPVTKALTDSFKAMNGKVGVLKRLGTPVGYDQLAEGNLDIAAYHLTPAAKDQSDLNALLGRSVTNLADAQAEVRAFLQNLSLNGQVNTAAIITTLCGTRMMRAATQLVLGCDSSRVSANFAKQRARFTADITDGVIWHALFQAAEVPPDGIPKAARFAVNGRCTLKTFLTMQEFQKVGTVKADKGFKVIA